MGRSNAGDQQPPLTTGNRGTFTTQANGELASETRSTKNHDPQDHMIQETRRARKARKKQRSGNSGTCRQSNATSKRIGERERGHLLYRNKKRNNRIKARTSNRDKAVNAQGEEGKREIRTDNA